MAIKKIFIFMALASTVDAFKWKHCGRFVKFVLVSILLLFFSLIFSSRFTILDHPGCCNTLAVLKKLREKP